MTCVTGSAVAPELRRGRRRRAAPARRSSDQSWPGPGIVAGVMVPNIQTAALSRRCRSQSHRMRDRCQLGFDAGRTAAVAQRRAAGAADTPRGDDGLSAIPRVEVSRRKGDEVTATSDARFQVGRVILEVARPFNTSNTFGFTTLMGLPAA